METISQHSKSATAEYELVLSYRYARRGREATKGFYVKKNDENLAEFFIKDFSSTEELPPKAGNNGDGTIVCAEYIEEYRWDFTSAVRSYMAEFLNATIARQDSITRVIAHGSMAEYHNWIINDAGIGTGEYWDGSEKVFILKIYINTFLRARVWIEKPHYFRAEFENLYPGAKFDFFTEEGDLHKGMHSETLKTVVKAHLQYFQYFKGENAKKLFGENICIVKNKPLGENKACIDCVRKFVYDREKDPRYLEYSPFIGHTAMDSATEIFTRLRDEKKSYEDVYLKR